jgi:SAM-dependent MidA family methyltransferase
MSVHLPVPSPEALAASRALSELIAAEIGSSNGWISFARYMELVLYAPGLGYYSGGSAKLGKDGDFTTAPEITPLFGAALARVVAPILQQSAPHVLEFGAGSGKLARDLLRALAQAGVVVERYAIVDLSGELRARQQETLRDFPQVEWLDRLPARFSGVVLGNEVLDAMPVQLLVKSADGWQERGVALGEAGFAFRDRPASATLAGQIPDPESLAPGYLTEVHPQASAFMRSLGAMLAAGAAILIDYGFPAREYYHPQRNAGTLMCHYRHHAHPDPFYLPGLQDVTAHVDFTAMARAASESGLDLLCYAGQAAFLLQAGVGELLLRTDPADAARYLPQANALQKLVSPAEMGELFKVLVAGRQVQLAPDFARCDRSHRL